MIDDYNIIINRTEVNIDTTVGIVNVLTTYFIVIATRTFYRTTRCLYVYSIFPLIFFFFYCV